jgi:hypothetical protein
MRGPDLPPLSAPAGGGKTPSALSLSGAIKVTCVKSEVEKRGGAVKAAGLKPSQPKWEPDLPRK